MKYEVEKDGIKFKFHPQKLTYNIKSIFSIAEADVQYDKGISKIKNENIADLNVYEIEKLNLPPVYPYRMKVEIEGRPTTPAFSSEIKFIGPKQKTFYQVKRTGVILNLDGKDFTLTNPHFSFLERLHKLSPDIKTPGERLSLWSEVIKVVPKDVILFKDNENDKKQLLDFQLFKADRFCLDQIKPSEYDFQIVPELIYTVKNNDDTGLFSQLPKGISLDLKNNFLKSNSVDPYYKMGNYYVQLSKPLIECLKVVKKINREPLEARRAFYMNPMERIKRHIPEDLSEDLLEEIFWETDSFKSDRISHIGQWVPKLGFYIDPDNKNPWFPKPCITLKIADNLFYFCPDDLDTLVKDLEQANRKNQDKFIYKSPPTPDQHIPVNDHVIDEIKTAKDKIIREAKKHTPSSSVSKSEDKKGSSKLVAIIKDNIDQKIYEASLKRKYFNRGIPSCLKAKFNKYSHQKDGVLWLEDCFIKGFPGALLADDMGLGKTFQALVFLYWYITQNIKNRKPALIVAPTGLLKNWQDEHDKHLPEYGLGPKYKAYGESFRIDRKKSAHDTIKSMEKSSWTLTTYESIRDHHVDFFVKVSWGIVVFDEIQKIKNPYALMTDASKALDSDFSVGLTGTPVENSFIDLWCISDCLQPKILGLLKDFHKEYIKDKSEIKEHSGQKIKDRLENRKPPFIKRRIKKSILNLPQKNIIKKEVYMKGEQKDAYSEIIRQVRCKEYSNSLQALAHLKKISIYTQDLKKAEEKDDSLRTDLKKISSYTHDCHSGSNTPKKNTTEEFIQSNAKLKVTFKILEDIKRKDEKALICIENRNLQKVIKGICDTRWALSISIINGDMPGDRRTKTVDKFGKIEGFNIMIISPRAGGVGLNIVSANHIVHLERWWNPAVEDQSQDRIFRIGQTRPVFVYYPLAVHPDYREQSFDIVLDQLIEKKRRLREQVLIPSEPNKHEQDELCRSVTSTEPYSENKESFSNSLEWKALRREVFNKYPPFCMRCRSKKNLEVDHIKPRIKYPDLELDFDNLQILCKDCNLIKGIKDSPEWNFKDKAT